MKKNDTKHSIDHDANPINEDSYLNLSKNHKDWYNISDMGKQRGKPHAVPQKVKKESKSWKTK